MSLLKTYPARITLRLRRVQQTRFGDIELFDIYVDGIRVEAIKPQILPNQEWMAKYRGDKVIAMFEEQEVEKILLGGK